MTANNNYYTTDEITFRKGLSLNRLLKIQESDKRRAVWQDEGTDICKEAVAIVTANLIIKKQSELVAN